MIPFSEVPNEAWFEHEGVYWAKHVADGNWNASTFHEGKERWGQFEPDEMVKLLPGTSK